jgi:hypothetical protein
VRDTGRCLNHGVSMSTTIEQLAGVAAAMHALLGKRADQPAGDIDGSADVREYLSILAAIMAYEGKRWPLGKVLGDGIDECRAAEALAR